MKFTASISSPPLGAALTVSQLPAGKVSVEWGKETSLQVSSNLTLETSAVISRYVARLIPEKKLYGSNLNERTEIDHWLSYALGPLSNSQAFQQSLEYLDEKLSNATYLVANKLSIADLNVFGSLIVNQNWIKMDDVKSFKNIRAWVEILEKNPFVKKVLDSLPDEVKTKTKTPAPRTANKDEGKFVELPGAEMGKVVVRFPPEASGFLHIGHAKAALLNWYYKQLFKGTLIMRFDDTNPDKEKVVFEKVILEDLKMLEIYPDKFTHTSDHFPLLIELCEKLLRSGLVYVDDTAPEVMKAEREARQPSENRDNPVDRNLSMWAEMMKGSEFGQRCCVRAKIDMNSDNGCMRDPTIYRCKNEPHPRTGTKYKVYPTYDFACPVVDSIEGVTHALRTMEYHDRDEQFYWFIDALKLRKPHIWEYSRLNMMNTVLSKRKLTWFVEQGLVDSWEDPRFPTVRGVLRRGMTVEGLKQFIIAQGSSRSVVQMEWDKIWAFNKKVIDPIAPRYTGLEANSAVRVFVKDAKEGSSIVPRHPKNPEIGNKTVISGPVVLIAQEDVPLLKEGENATFINWGNLRIIKVLKDGAGKATKIDAELNIGDTDYKKTPKLTWLADTANSYIPFEALYFEHIISKPVLAKDEDFKQYINYNSRKSVKYIGDPDLATLKKGDIIQLQRIGYFRVDVAGSSPVLIHIPDGSTRSPLTSAITPNQKAASGANEKVLTDADIEAIAVKWQEDRNNQNQVAGAPAAVFLKISADADLSNQIDDQGEKVRQLKASKANKSEVDTEVKILLDLKAKYKKETGQDYKPTTTPPASKLSTNNSSDVFDINTQITEQGNKVRELKSAKASKQSIDEAVKILLELKQKYKAATGSDWKPGSAPVVTKAVAPPVVATAQSGSLSSQIAEQGNLVRKLKADKANKAEIDGAVKTLLDLKKQFKCKTGQEWKPESAPPVPVVSSPSVATAKVGDLSSQIAEQGNLVRKLKADKANKAEIDGAVKLLLDLKKQFKSETGQEWKPESAPPVQVVSSPPVSTPKLGDLSSQIGDQGNLVRKLKADKATKAEIDNAVKVLLELKKQYKSETGQEWKPESAPPVQIAPKESSNAPVASPGTNTDSNSLSEQISQQGNKVRELKAQKSDKKIIDAAVKELLTLKENYKNLTGADWQPGAIVSMSQDLNDRIAAQGNKIRDLKAGKAEKSVIDAEVQALLALKAEFKNTTGQEWKPAVAPARKAGKEKSPGIKAEKKPPKQEKKVEKEQPGTGGDKKKQSRLGLEAKKEENLSDWYSQVITKGELIEYYDVSGCYILRPWSFAVWEAIKDFLDSEIKKLGVVNAYFPMFVSKSVLEREKAHIADFAPEVAWVTRSGESELAEHIAIRPTSETAMYPAYSKWIQSHRDLPLRLNQWNNVVRWEFKHPQPFLRTREFLWQEGHTAFASYEEAEEEVYQILDLYARVYTDLLAVPVVKGRKTEKEKFAGGDYTTTVEAFISASGRGIQGATSHHLGQNFSKMFDIAVENESKEKMFVHQNSWGLTTRTIGVMVMVHADNMGLVMPPAVSAVQVVIVPCGITASLPEAAKLDLVNTCSKLHSQLMASNIRSKLDVRDNYSPGWKFNHWELKGVPLRVEVGPKDLEKKQVVAVRRDDGAKVNVPLDSASNQIRSLLDVIQASLLAKAQKDLADHTKLVEDWKDFAVTLDAKNIILAPFCEGVACEDNIKRDSARDEELEPGAPAMGAKSLCIPFDQPRKISSTDKCIHPNCGLPAKSFTLFGRSY